MAVSNSTVRTPFLRRLIGAAALDVGTYEEVEADQSATVQAMLVVLMSSLAAGIGAHGYGDNTVANVIFMSILSLLLWAGWALVTFEVGVRLLPGSETRADVGQLLRTIGFASTPGLLRVMGLMEAITLPVLLVSWTWMLLAMIVAVRQALDYRSTGRAVAVCVLGWALAVGIVVVTGLLFGPVVSFAR
jgi:hypothetical protein